MKKTILTVALMLAAATPGMAQTGGVKILVPIAPVMAQPQTQALLKGVKVSFGADASKAALEGADIKVMSWARPGDPRSQDFGVARMPDGRPGATPPEVLCQLAVRYTLENLADEAIERGSREVVDVVSVNENVVVNNPTHAECVIWRASTEANLKGRALKTGAQTAGVSK